MMESQTKNLPASPFGEPVIEYSGDEGKSWSSYGAVIWENSLARVVTKDGFVLWMGRAIPYSQKCTCCEGTGIQERWRYERIDTSARNHTSSDLL